MCNNSLILRNNICDDALNEIAAFESFISDYVTRQSDASGTSSTNGGGGGGGAGVRKSGITSFLQFHR